jgi:hypothetical protein
MEREFFGFLMTIEQHVQASMPALSSWDMLLVEWPSFDLLPANDKSVKDASSYGHSSYLSGGEGQRERASYSKN